MNIPHFDQGGEGGPLHFLHANGYPPECYQPLLEHLQNQHHVFGMKLRPLWGDANMNELRDWHPYSEDLLRFLSDVGPDPVIGVGHSIGGTVTLRAAMRTPEKFRAIVLLDPVLFVPPFMMIWNVMRATGLGERTHPLIAGAKKRRRLFDNLETVFRGYRSRSIFRYMSDEGLRTYIQGITRINAEGKFELAFSPEWEAHIYLTGMRDFDLWRGLPNFSVPTLIIRGAETDTFMERAERLIKKKNSNIQIVTMPKATHILPLEHPQEVAQLIEDFLKKIHHELQITNPGLSSAVHR
ncbi:MAG TPA: alpha/beta hydrolase [Anaerolineales bacterium]|nr:alpha/beta hydrolase [Anaerolineales bacterium]HNN12551.1 alpha/beta hydrolase [Anaerolineales bacterium]HNO30346.1 alpha/beta hydrolase [Anaerolineales bacterium]